MLNKKWDDKVQTACVGIRGINYELVISEKYWTTLTDKSQRGLLKHELLHIGFFHLTDFSHLSDQEVANLAMDCEINQYIDPDDLPPGPILPSSFPELNLEPKKGTMYYYDKLMQGQKNNTCPNLTKMLEAMKEGQGTVQISIGQGSGTQEIQLPEHGSWGELEALPEATQKLIKKQTEHILKEIADQVVKSRGVVPGEFAQILERINQVEPAKFDWRGYLRRFAGGSTKIYTKKTRRKFNKRYEENPGLKIKPRRHILFAIDTSGSVSTSELQECMNELYHIHKTGTDITLLQCDTAISDISPFNVKKDIIIKGRGGTDFQPVIDYYNENVHKYTCLMYFTDGECSAPTPAKGRMLWVLSSQSPLNPSLIGPQIKLN
jgi:predicted metal-dependent peptidase